jgi:hypothetical protein
MLAPKAFSKVLEQVPISAIWSAQQPSTRTGISRETGERRGKKEREKK